MVYRTLITMNRVLLKELFVKKSACTWSLYVQTLKVQKLHVQRFLNCDKFSLEMPRFKQLHISPCSCLSAKIVERHGIMLKGDKIGKLLMHHGYATMAVDNDVLMKYLGSLVNEYNDMLQSNSKGGRSKEINTRKVYLMPIVELYRQLKEKSDELDELKQLAAGMFTVHVQKFTTCTCLW